MKRTSENLDGVGVPRAIIPEEIDAARLRRNDPGPRARRSVADADARGRLLRRRVRHPGRLPDRRPAPATIAVSEFSAGAAAIK